MNKSLAVAAAAAAVFTAAALGSAALAQDRAALIEAALAAPDRTDAERERDQRRRPAISLDTSPVQPGDRVLDLSSGPGYMARLYASLVGPEGHVTAQNPPAMLERAPQIATVFEEMAAARGNVDLMLAPAGALTAEDASYDVVAITLSYHDRVNGGDSAAMNAEAFRVLKPGGRYFIVDHNAEAGSGARDTQTMHRIDKAYVQVEVEAAGFTLESESHAMENPNDTLTGGNRDDAGSSQFALTFVKPAG
jgi:predicted methyltransferase